MNLRRFLWVALIISLGVMLMMAYLQRRVPRVGASATQPAGGTAAQSAPSGAEPPAPAATQPQAGKPETDSPAPAATAPASQPTPPGAAWANTLAPVEQRVLGSLERQEGDYYRMQVRLTSLGAAVESIRLTDYFMTVADKQRYQQDPATYEQGVKANPKLKGHYLLVAPVASDGEEIYPLATRWIEFPAQGGKALKLAGARWVAGEVSENKEGDTQSVTFTSEVFRDGRPFVRLRKTYSLKKGSYSLQVALELENLAGAKQSVDLTQLAVTGVPREDFRSDRRALAYAKEVKNEVKVLKNPVGNLPKLKLGLGNAEALGTSDAAEPVLWIGEINKYFAALAYVVPETPETLAAPQAKARFFAAAIPAAGEESGRAYLSGMYLGAYELEPGASATVELDVFAGPKRPALFDNTPLYKALHYKDTIEFGACCPVCAFPWLSLAMMWLLDVFSKATFGNYGLAIILLVILVRIALHPLTKKSQLSMSRMQKLQPEVAKLREKYKDDKAKLNEEMMKLYRTQGARPLLGCLPMLLQFPIWIALWTGLQASVELRHAAFLPVWITDLAAPDELISFGRAFSIWLIGNMTGPITGLNLLPILVTVAMLLQQKFAPTTAASDQQAKQQKTMMYFFNIFLLLVFYNAPSGLNLYIMTSTFAGVAEQYVIRKHIREKEAAEAAIETRVSMPGKHFRGQKPKKPKGPFRFTR